MVAALVSVGTSFVGSFVAVGIWSHFDIEGFFEQRKHARLVRLGEKLERKRVDAHVRKLTREFKRPDA